MLFRMFEKVSASPCIECRRRAIVHLMETYEAQRDFDRAIEAIRKLDSPENDVADRPRSHAPERAPRTRSGRARSWTGRPRAAAARRSRGSTRDPTALLNN